MIKYAIPGLYHHYIINVKLLELMKENPEYFYPNIQIEAVYGVFPFCIFDGGRIFDNNEHASIEEIVNIVTQYHQYGVASRLVYTNSQLTPDNYTNKFGNLCLSICNQYNNNQIVLADSNFMDYIKINYPNLSCISSTTKCLNKAQFLDELHNDNFIEICLDYNLNHNWEILNNLNPKEKDKCEFLCNAICPPGCPTRKRHYTLNSLYNLSFGKSYDIPYCGIKAHSLSPECKKYSNNITYEEIVNKYEPNGFSHFKLEGRTFSHLEQVLIYSDYMVKPEYKDLFIAIMLR